MENNDKLKFFLTVDQPYTTYGPGDTVRGTATLAINSPLLSKCVIVSLLAICRITNCSNPRTPQKHFLHKQFKILLHNKRLDPSKRLSQGQHKWNFEFRLPSTNQLPPSFVYKDENGTAEVLYCVAIAVYRSNSASTTTFTSPIQYAPKRHGTPMPDAAVYLKNQLTIRMPMSGDGGWSRKTQKLKYCERLARLLGVRRATEQQVQVTLWLPQQVPFSDHLDLSVKVETQGENAWMQARLIRVEYRLWASTRIGDRHAPRTLRHQLQENICPCSTILDSTGLWTSIRRHAPFRVQPLLSGTALDKRTYSCLCPSFGTHNLLREYVLDVSLFVSVCDVVHKIGFEGNGLVLLPHEFYVEND